MVPSFDIRSFIRQRFARSIEDPPKLRPKPRQHRILTTTDAKTLHSSYKEYSSLHHRQRTEPVHVPHKESEQKERIGTFNARRSTVNTNDFARYFDGKKSLLYHNNQTMLYKLDIRGEQRPYAVKVLLIDGNTMARELYYLKQLKNPNIIELKHYFITKLKNGKMSLHMIIPYMPYTLKGVLDRFPLRPTHQHDRRAGILPKIFYKLMMYQLIRGVAYLHSKNIMHRDLHPANVLIDLQSLELKICDFNSAKPFAKGENNSFYVGSREYRAPELLLGSTSYSHAVDLWAVGCLMVELYHGVRLFTGKKNNDVLADVIKVLGVPTKDELVAMNAPIKDLKIPPIKTITFEERFRGFYYADGFNDLIGKLLIYSPESRLPAFECLLHPFFNEIKHPSVRINQQSLPNLFNFTDEELQKPIYADNAYRLIPEWYKLKQKRNKYLHSSIEDSII